MTEPTQEVCLLNDLAHEFTQRLRQGERPSIQEFAQRFPHLATEIREIFPTLELIESSQSATTSEVSNPGRNPLWKSDSNCLGEYRILREVGRGGMGVVFEAIQEPLGRRVALKVLPARSLAAAPHLARFRREARAAANLHHTNIVPVYDMGEADGAHFYAMQFIDGQPMCAPETSSSTFHTGARKAYYRQVAGIGRQVAIALAYAHSEGVIHRDIKPSNLLLDKHGAIWITDFGLAQVAGQDELTSVGDVVGTLRYLAPERFEGQMDERGDIYSLGVTLFEILTGRPPFAANTRAELIDHILHSRPTPLRRISPEIPRDLETIVLKAMSHNPSQRYARAELLAEDLERFLKDRPIRARRLSAGGHAWRWCRRNQALAATIMLAATLSVAIFILSLVDSVRIRNQLYQTQVARREAGERLFDSLVSQAHAHSMGGERFGCRFGSLAVLREATSLAGKLQLPKSSFSRLRDEAIAALCLPDEEIAQLIDAYPVGTAMVDFDPQIQRYARGDIDGNVTIHRVPDNQVLHRLPNSGPGFKLALWDGVVFSPDGVYLQHRCQDDQHQRSHLRLWDVSGVQPRLAFEMSERFVGLTAFAPDSRHLAVVVCHLPPAPLAEDASTNQVHVLDLASGRDVARPLEADDTTRLVFHPTEPQLAISDAAGVRIVRWDTGAELGRWNRPHTTPLAWSPDGRLLLARSDTDSNIHPWDVARRREFAAWDGHHRNQIDRIVFSHSGDRFISTSQFRFQMWDFPSGQLLWDSPQGALMGIRFSRDDQLLAGVHGVYPTVRILRVANGRELRRLALASPTDHGFPKALLNADGRMLAATSQAGTVLLDLQTYEQLAVIPGVRIPISFDPDGALITHASEPEGVVRWPITVDAETPLQISIGTPQTLTELQDGLKPEQSLFGGLENWSVSQDTRVIATPWQRDRAGANVFIADADDGGRETYRRVELGAQHDVRFTSVSPGGKWVATGSTSWMAERDEAIDTVTIWDAVTGGRVKDMWVGEGCPQFSPDGAWIAITSSGFPEGVRVWRVGSWESAPVPRPVPNPGQGAVAFDAESQMMAVQGHRIRLLVPETGRELAWLTVPEETSLAPQCFTPDGTRLIAFGVNNGSLYIWDLRAIRKQLAELGLDWDT